MGMSPARDRSTTALYAPDWRRWWAAAAATTLAVATLTACGGDGDDAGGSTVEADAGAGESVDDPGASGGAADGDESGGDDDSAGGEASGAGGGSLTWDGETYVLDVVECSDEPLLAEYSMLGRGTDAPTLTVLIRYDGLAAEPDLSQPDRIELFFPEGSTVGESQGFEARGDAITGVTASAGGASGTLELGPDGDTAATTSGQLDFEIVCG